MASKVVQTILFVTFLTIILSYIPNRSNFSSSWFVPLLASFTTKYVLGDWDIGYQFSYFDILYWITLLGLSYSIHKTLTQ